MDHLWYFCLVLLYLLARLFVDTLWSPAGKGLTSGLSFLMSNCDVVTFPLVSWVGCGVWLYRFLIFSLFLIFMQAKYLCILILVWVGVGIDTVEPVWAPDGMFYRPFQAVLLLWFIYVFLSCVCYAFVRVCLFVPWSPRLGKGWTLGSRLRSITVSLSISHWYLRSGVVLDRIDSWFLHPYLLCNDKNSFIYFWAT